MCSRSPPPLLLLLLLLSRSAQLPGSCLGVACALLAQAAVGCRLSIVGNWRLAIGDLRLRFLSSWLMANLVLGS
jgi:hypothetical protein